MRTKVIPLLIATSATFILMAAQCDSADETTGASGQRSGSQPGEGMNNKETPMSPDSTPVDGTSENMNSPAP